MTEGPVLQFVFDHHVNGPALRQLRARGVDVVSAYDVGLADVDDPDILRWAQGAGRIVVTRNYRDFTPLVQAYVNRGQAFSGVLFYATSVRESDVGAHVRALEDWIQRARAAGCNTARDSFEWLR